MIEQKTFYAVKCDGCKVLHPDEESEYTWWDDEGYAIECTGESGWLTKDEKHFCGRCWWYNDEDDEVTILEAERPKPLSKLIIEALKPLVKD